jgi:hypothetical protein
MGVNPINPKLPAEAVNRASQVLDGHFSLPMKAL